MLTYFRYALATFCFAASVGCLALWGYSANRDRQFVNVTVIGPGWLLDFQAQGGTLHIARHRAPSNLKYAVHFASSELHEPMYTEVDSGPGRWFGLYERETYFPLWYPALIFALAGVATLRLGRRFTLRSAIIATTVVAGLLGMAVGL
jgi:hypothetical protein